MKVSVCCLAYNQEDTIGQAIEGVLAQQTDFDYELIIHEDASTDRTAEVIRAYEKQYPNIIRVIYQTENQYHKCNLAKEYLDPLVTGEYVAICEGDDYWIDPLKLQKQVDYMDAHPECTMTMHGIDQLDAEGKRTEYFPMTESGIVQPELVIKSGGLFCPTVSLVIRSDMCRKWPEFRIRARVYDYPMQILCATEGNVYYFHEKMGVYRYASEGSWTKEREKITDFDHIDKEIEWLQLFDEYSKGQYSQAIRFQIARLWLAEYKKALNPICGRKAKESIRELKGKERQKLSIAWLGLRIGGKLSVKLIEGLRRSSLWSKFRRIYYGK